MIAVIAVIVVVMVMVIFGHLVVGHVRHVVVGRRRVRGGFVVAAGRRHEGDGEEGREDPKKRGGAHEKDLLG